MEYISAYYWQEGENAASLLLKQCRYQDIPLFFACVCPGEDDREQTAGGYLARRLSEWFCGMDFHRAVKEGDLFLRRQAVRLENLVCEADRELSEAGLNTFADTGREPNPKGGSPGCGGILCIGQECLLFGRGDVQIRLLNCRMGRPNGEMLLSGGQQLCVRQAVMEADIGVLLAAGAFGEAVRDTTPEEGLSAGEVLTQRQAERHLRELGEAGERAGGRNMAAVLFYLRED